MRYIERIARTGWIIAEPFVRLAYAAKLCGYQHVNTCIGARRRDRFDPLWHWEHFGTPVESLPECVTLCGIGYSATHSEGMVSFVEEEPMFGMGSRVWFTRDPDSPYPSSWACQVSGRQVSAEHIVSAYRWVEAVFGGTFERKRAA